MIKRKKIIIILLILIMIVALSLLIVVISMKNKNDIMDNVEYEYPEQEFYVEKVKDVAEFYTVKSIVNSYENMIINNENIKIYSILNKNYIDENKITTENVLDYVDKTELNEENDPFDEIKIIIESMLCIKEENNIFTNYYVKGFAIKNNDYSTRDEINIMIKLDSQNNLFSIAPSKYIEQKELTNIKEGDQIYIDSEPLESNDYNYFEYRMVTNEEIVWDYFSQYKSNLLYGNMLDSYNMLDLNYREKKFGNYEGFQKYVQNNIINIIKAKIESYQVKTSNNSNRYICLDQYGNYYIFNETAVMEFSLVLDTYTIDLPEFTEKYNSGTDQQKVALNIDKFIQAINTTDYKYAYNCLADSFKNNYFKTQEEFETYAKENFYARNTVTYNQFDMQGEYYTYSITITNQETSESINKTFIMELGEGTEFKLSFNR